MAAIQPTPALAPIPSREYPTPAVRPMNSVLSNDKLARTLGLQAGSWQDNLQLYIALRGIYLQILSVSVFEKTHLQQALQAASNISEKQVNSNQLNLFNF